MQKIVSVLSFRKVDKEIIDDADMGGPVLIAIIFGFLLLLVSLRVNFSARKNLLWVHLWIWINRMYWSVFTSMSND